MAIEGVAAVKTKMRDLLVTEAGAPDPGKRQYAVLVITAVLAAAITGAMLDLQSPALLAGLTAVFTMVAAGGQSLRSDLRRLLTFAPALLLVMGTGPLLVRIPVLAGLLVAVVVFASGMLPALGEQYRVRGQTFAAATLMSTTTGLGADQPAAILYAAALAGVLLALVMRVLVGLVDPTRLTRVAVARVLVEPGPGVVELAANAWRADGSATWLGRVLAGAARFRAARETLLAQAQQADRFEAERLREIVSEADHVADELAKAARARACKGLPTRARLDPAAIVLARGGRQDLPEAARAINEGFETIRDALLHRVRTPAAPATPGGGTQQALESVRAHLSLRSSLFRHALRCTLAVCLGMVIVLLLHDPSAASMLLALCVVLQPATRDSMNGALERTGAAVLGVVAIAALITLLPGAYLLVPLVVAGMLLNVERVRENYSYLLSGLIAVTVVNEAMQLDRPLINVAISFAANTAVGTAIALIIGYVSYLVLPSSRVPDVHGTVRATVWSVSELLRSVHATGRGADLHGPMLSAHVLALRRTQDLLGVPALLESTDTVGDKDAVRSAAIALDALRQDVATLAFRPADERELAVPSLRAVDDLLGGRKRTNVPDVPPNRAPATELLASSVVENALHARKAIDKTLGDNNPWKSYAISYLRPERLHI